MKQLTARDMAQIAIVAAIYIVLTITPPPQRYGLLWLSIPCFGNDEFLSFYNKKYLIAVTLGCMDC